MHAAVGATGGDRLQRRIGNERQRRFERRLHRRTVAKTLPTEQAGAIVFDADCVAHGEWIVEESRLP
ncbi:hypothetical protein D3C83_302440 [compost metagenome]